MTIGGLFGFLIGAWLGLTGAGGGILAVPALVFGLAALIAVGMAAIMGALQGLRQGTVRYKAAALLAATGAMASPLGVCLAHLLPDIWLTLVFAVVMLMVACRMFASSRRTAPVDEPSKVPQGFQRHRAICVESADLGDAWLRRHGLRLVHRNAGHGRRLHHRPGAGVFQRASHAQHCFDLADGDFTDIRSDRFDGLDPRHGPHCSCVGFSLAARIPAVALQRGFSLVCVIVAAVMVTRSFG